MNIILILNKNNCISKESGVLYMYYFVKNEKTKADDEKMIVMDLKVDNFFAFKNFHLNMAYPKKIVDTHIENEFLADRPNFRYKKLIILLGGNATGKTSCGKMIMNIFNFIERKNLDVLIDKICDSTKMAHFSIDFVVKKNILYRVEAYIGPLITGEEPSVKVSVKFVEIRKQDSYESCIKRIQMIQDEPEERYVLELEKVERLTWIFRYTSDGFEIKNNLSDEYLEILEYVMRALDISILSVKKSAEVDNSYIIRTKSKELIVQEGEFIKGNILSSGTQAGISIAEIINAIKHGGYGFHYCDELFSCVHSDIELAFLTVMISSLQERDQLFFTTHNSAILDLPFPKHSFVFLKKDLKNVEQPIKCVNASDFLKRNSDSVRNAWENDLFSVAPSVDLIYEIENL